MLKQETLHNIYMIFAMLCLAICGSFIMLASDTENDAAHLGYVLLLTFAILVPGFFMYIKTRLRQRPPTAIICLSVLLIWMVLIWMIYMGSHFRMALAQCLRILISLGALCLSYAFANKFGINKYICWAAVVMQVILIARYISIYSVTNLFLGEAHLLTAYYPLFLLPLVLIHPNKVVRYSSVLITTLIIFSSVKRGGLIALMLGLLVYVICYQHIHSRGIKAILYTFVTLGSIALIFFYFANSSEFGGIIERLMTVKDDGGSGRDNVWEVTWNMIQQSNGIQYLIGHGYNAVMIDSPEELSAHNDFLEAWYDFGLIGLGLYVVSLIALIRQTVRFIRKKSAVAPSLAMLLIFMLILGMISHVLIYYFMTLCCMTIGLLVGQENHNEHIE